jgi:hypothetical protein
VIRLCIFHAGEIDAEDIIAKSGVGAGEDKISLHVLFVFQADGMLGGGGWAGENQKQKGQGNILHIIGIYDLIYEVLTKAIYCYLVLRC